MIKSIRFVFNLTLGISAILLLSVFLRAGYWFAAPLLGISALFWFFARNWISKWPATAVLVLFLAVSAFGLMKQLEIPWLLFNSILILVFWDLHQFAADIPASQPENLTRTLGMNHLRTLAILVALSVVLLLIVAFVSFEIPFGWIILLTIILVVGFVALVRKVNQHP
jgi:hypothetical protein